MAAPLERYLDRSDALAALQAHAARLARVDAVFRQSLPPHLSTACAVANLRADGLVVHAEGGAVAAKLRQAIPGLIERLASAGIVVAGIKVRVRPPRTKDIRPPIAQRNISPEARREMDAFAASLPADSPVGEALRRLIDRN